MDSKDNQLAEQKITRKEALTKAGKYAFFTAAVSTALLAPRMALAQSTGGLKDPGWGTGGGYSPPGGGTGTETNSLFTKPEPPTLTNGLKDSPWK